jgi:spore coat protein U-like protein
VNVSNRTRTATALVAGAALFAAVSAGAYAIPDTFNVSTTISASCSVTDSGPADLYPSYTPSTDTSVGAETVLNTSCSGSSPTVTFTDPTESFDNEFFMTSGSQILFFQISNTSSCSGVAGDNPLLEGVPYALSSGVGAFDICAAVISGGLNTGVPAGVYTDTVTYSISP